MFLRKLSVVPATSPLAAVAVVLSLFLSACSTSPAPDKTAGWSPNKIYSEARDEASSGAYDKAIPLYEKLEGRAAGTPLAQQAQLEKAYAQYKGGEPAQALSTLDRFIKLHPASPALDYAMYLKGLSWFAALVLRISLFQLRLLGQRRSSRAAFEFFEKGNGLVVRA